MAGAAATSPPDAHSIHGSSRVAEHRQPGTNVTEHHAAHGHRGAAFSYTHLDVYKGQTLRYWHVAGDRHGQGIGSRLMHAFLARCAESRRVTLWVVADNAAAIAKYHHYGFGEDGMIDDIMVKRAKVVG